MSTNTSPKIKIVILVNELLRGGAQRIILDIAKNINRTVFPSHCVYLKSHENFESNIKTLCRRNRNFGNPSYLSLWRKTHFSMGDCLAMYRFLRNEKNQMCYISFFTLCGHFGEDNRTICWR